ncbi:MAG: M64 family metallopeptidase [Prolixibacteraceae bacterium]|jgi:hypothetical protein|nr:M64 family metallopeptidase [Prolixibacteraceae bacterium]
MIRQFIIILFFLPLTLKGQITFEIFFINKSMRFDFLIGGNSEEAVVYPGQIKQEPYWAGSKKNLTDDFNYGTYRFRIFDLNTGSLLFSKGFCTLFQEWQTTAEAKKINKTFYHAVIFPYPNNKVRLEIDARQWKGNFKTIYRTEIDPDDYFILKEKPYPYETVVILENGKPENKVDLVILSEGYTEAEKEKFISDASRVTGYLFDEEPFTSNKNNFNIMALFAPSEEKGTDIPGEKIYKNTVLNSSFYTFDVPRYLTTSDMKTIYDMVAGVPYDHIYVLVNTERYGGGGFYNFLSVCSSDNHLTRQVFVHEFGHGFAGLADEYYTSEVAYENFYNLKVEPWEPNITTLVDFNTKWKSMISKNTPVPTPRSEQFSNTTGVFEGGGYMSKGIYSPYMDCRMKSNNAEKFCPVCIQAIQKVIDNHCDN